MTFCDHMTLWFSRTLFLEGNYVIRVSCLQNPGWTLNLAVGRSGEGGGMCSEWFLLPR